MEGRKEEEKQVEHWKNDDIELSMTFKAFIFYIDIFLLIAVEAVIVVEAEKKKKNWLSSWIRQKARKSKKE